MSWLHTGPTHYLDIISWLTCKFWSTAICSSLLVPRAKQPTIHSAGVPTFEKRCTHRRTIRCVVPTLPKGAVTDDFVPNLGESTANDVSMRHGFLRESWKHISSNLHRFCIIWFSSAVHSILSTCSFLLYTLYTCIL